MNKKGKGLPWYFALLIALIVFIVLYRIVYPNEETTKDEVVCEPCSWWSWWSFFIGLGIAIIVVVILYILYNQGVFGNEWS